MVGCETAEYLAEKGCQVSVIEMMDKIAAGESETILPTLKENYKKYGVAEYPSHKVEEIQMGKVICRNKAEEEVIIDCDFVVLAMGAKPVSFDTTFLEEAKIPFAKIGDCGERAADIANAVRTAYDTVNAIS
ncbi:NADH:flavin oxidoreductase/NADH oxidase [gut metagenome]|uniref:NADH:flavin oxidoreductase/NADH oxidase n=1 Tax=gut metagenome TaxID=749906 RepID=J9GXA5_9ZZZZ